MRSQISLKDPAFLLVIIFFLLSSSNQGLADSQNFSKKTSHDIIIKPPLSAPRLGENLIFDVFWMGVPVGTGTLEVAEKVDKNGREAYHVIARAKSSETLSKIYPIEDEVHSFIDTKTLKSLEFSKKVKEGRYRADEKITYDYGKMKGVYESLLNKNRKEIDLSGEVHDMISAFFWARLQPIQVGQKLHVMVNSEEKNWDVEVQVLSAQMKELRGNRQVPTVLVEPKTKLKGVLYNRGRVWVYLSTDEKREPVWVTFKTPFGPVTGVLRRSGD